MSTTRRKIILPIAILAVGALAAILMVTLRGPVPTRPAQDYAPLVRTTRVAYSPHTFSVITQGTVSPRTESELVSEVSGRVVSVSPSFGTGTFFDRREVILRIDPVDYELAVVTAKSGVARALVRVETEEAAARVARQEWDELGDGSDAPLATRELQLAEARAALEAARAALRQAQRNLDRTHIRAPYPCRIRAKLVDIGRYVAPGTPLARVYATDYAEIRLPMRDEDLAYLHLPIDFRGASNDSGPVVHLSAEFAGSVTERTGRIVRVEGEIDPSTRMVHVVARVDDPYGRQGGFEPLPVGLFVEAVVEGRTAQRAAVLPRSALRNNQTVLVVGDDNRLYFRPVDVIRTEDDTVIIAGGIEEGEIVCTSILDAVTDGMRIRVAPHDTADPDATESTTAATRGGSR